MANATIMINDSTLKKLHKLKHKLELRSVDSTINYLIKNISLSKKSKK